jgi:hypothetical protein
MGEDPGTVHGPMARSVGLVSETGEIILLALQHPASSPWLYWLVPSTPCRRA